MTPSPSSATGGRDREGWSAASLSGDRSGSPIGPERGARGCFGGSCPAGPLPWWEEVGRFLAAGAGGGVVVEPSVTVGVPFGGIGAELGLFTG